MSFSHSEKQEPYPLSLSAAEPLLFYEAEMGLEVLVIQAKENQNMISTKLFSEVKEELNRLVAKQNIPKDKQLMMQQLLKQYEEAASAEGNRIKVDLEKMQAILHIFQKS